MSVHDSTEQDTALAGAGASLSEAGCTPNTDAGPQSVADRAAEVGWGRDVAETGQEPPATNDGTGQSEKPA